MRENPKMNRRLNWNWNRNAQLVVVLLCAGALKFFYSAASVNQLRWILAPTTFLVELVTGTRFQFESYAGYMSSDHTFLIAASCAGVNFLITAFLMLSLGKLWRARSQKLAWRFIPIAAVFAYVATLVANTVRISTALRLRSMPLAISWLTPDELHRLEGILIYFGFLLLLLMVSEKMSYRNLTSRSSDRSASLSSEELSGSARRSGLLRSCLFALLVYYATTLGIPLVTGAYRPGAVSTGFWEHSLFVLLTPLVLILPLAVFRFFRGQRA